MVILSWPYGDLKIKICFQVISRCFTNEEWTWVWAKSGLLHHCNGGTWMNMMIQSDIWGYNICKHTHMWIGQLGLLSLVCGGIWDGCDWFHLESAPLQAHALDRSNRLWTVYCRMSTSVGWKLHEVFLWTRFKVVSVACGGIIWEWKVDPVPNFMLSTQYSPMPHGQNCSNPGLFSPSEHS